MKETGRTPKGCDLSFSRTIVVCGDIEAGTLLQPLRGFHHPVAVPVRTEVTVSADLHAREVLLQDSDKRTEGEFLTLGTGVGRKTLGVQATFVGDADAFPVVTPGMGADFFQRSGAPDETVLADVEVVAHHPHPPCPVTTEQISLREVHIGTGGGAVYHNQRNPACHPTHAVTPNAPAMAEATAITIFNTISHTFFFFSGSVVLLMFV